MPQPDHAAGSPESGTTLTPFAAQVGSALDAAGINWRQDDDGDLHVIVAPDEGKPLHVFFRALEPEGERILLVVVFDVLPGLDTPALLPLSRTTVLETLNWLHQRRLGVTFHISKHNYVACRCDFPVYGRPRREQVETMFSLVLSAASQAQAALRAVLQGASLEQALRLVADFPEPSSTDDEDAAT